MKGTGRFLPAVAIMMLPLLAFARSSAPDTISARRAFVEMPEIQLDLLMDVLRPDMLDYYDNDSIYNTYNSMLGQAHLEKVTDNFLSVSLTPASTLQLKVLSLANGDDIVAASYTVGEPDELQDSELTFYSPSFRTLDAGKYFKQPSVGDFFDTKGDKKKLKEIERLLPFKAVVYDFSPDNGSLTARLSYRDVLSVEDRRVIEPFLKPSLSYIWNGKKFVLKK